MARLITGEVLYGEPAYGTHPRCDRCGAARRGSAWWAPMTRPDGEQVLGWACADCHTPTL